MSQVSIEFWPGADILASKAQALVNPVNCIGVAGAGLALAFKNKRPLILGALGNVPGLETLEVYGRETAGAP